MNDSFILIVSLILVLLLMFLFYGSYKNRTEIKLEKEALFGQFIENNSPISNSDLTHLPSRFRSYLIKSGVIGKDRDSRVRFGQLGQIKTAQNKKWKQFKATQYMSSKIPGFIWSATSFPLFIRDKSICGIGEVKVNLLGFKDVAKFGDQKTNESALVRYLGELMFYPMGFLNSNISWEELSYDAVKATLKVNNVLAQGVFFFNENGLLYRFESNRYMGETLEKFKGIAEDYTMMEGLYIPSKMKAIWQLKNGEFEYFNAQITNYKIA